MEKRDAKGRTEQEYLNSYTPGNYPRPSLTADIVLLSEKESATYVLLIRRKAHPFLDCWALPGGFANPHEAIEDTAARELYEETGVSGVYLNPVGLFSTPGRDPRGWVVSQAFVARVDHTRMTVKAGDDAKEAAWFEIQLDHKEHILTLRCKEQRIHIPMGLLCEHRCCADERVEGLAFDHAQILFKALRTPIKISIGGCYV